MAVGTAIGLVSKPVVRRTNTTVVYLKGQWSGEWEYVPYLEAVEAEERDGQSVSTATFRYRYGSIKREDWNTFEFWTPLLIQGAFCAVYTFNQFGGMALWYGRIAVEDVDPDGTSWLSGTQVFRAYGLEQILSELVLDISYTDAGEIRRGIVFNGGRKGRGPGRNTGNRSTDPDLNGVFFFDANAGEDWTNLNILGYAESFANTRLAEYGSASEFDGLSFFIFGTLSGLDRMTESHQFYRRTVKHIVDTLCNRNRGLSYRIVTTGSGVVGIEVYSTHRGSVYVGGVEWPGNNNVADVNLTGVIDMSMKLRENTISKYRGVRVEGGAVSVCCTITFDNDDIEAGWGDTEKTDYDAGSALPGATARDHDLARRADKFDAVYQRFVVPDDWTRQVKTGVGEDTDNAAPDVSPEGVLLLDQVALWSVSNPLPFSRHLPFEEDTGYSTDSKSMRRPFAIVSAEVEAVTKYFFVEKAELEGVRVGAHFRPDDQEKAFRVQPAINHLYALNDWPEEAVSDVDPVWDYSTLQATVMFPTDVTLSARHGPSGDSKHIYIPGAEAWVVLDGTVLDVVDGALQRQGDREVIRDDSGIVRSVASAAINWYSVPRNIVQIHMNFIANYFPVGQNIRSATVNWFRVPINTTVTTRQWKFTTNPPTCRVATGFDDLHWGILTERWR